jgi:hypothetical protein
MSKYLNSIQYSFFNLKKIKIKTFHLFSINFFAEERGRIFLGDVVSLQEINNKEIIKASKNDV